AASAPRRSHEWRLACGARGRARPSLHASRAPRRRAHPPIVRRGREQREARVPRRRGPRARDVGSADDPLSGRPRGGPVEDPRVARRRGGAGANSARARPRALASPREGRGQERWTREVVDPRRDVRGAPRRRLPRRRLRTRACRRRGALHRRRPRAPDRRPPRLQDRAPGADAASLPRDAALRARRGKRPRPPEALRLGDHDQRPALRPRRRTEQEDGGAGRRDGGARRALARRLRRVEVRRLAAAALVLLSAVGARAEPMRPIAGVVPRALASMEDLGPAPADLRLHHLTVFLGLRDRATLEAIVAAQQDRRSPRYHQWLDVDEIADRFGPRRAEYERVRRWFVDRGFDVVRDSPFRMTLVVAGTVAQVQSSLPPPIGLLRRRGKTYRAARVDPSLPESIAASVRGMIGLDDLPAFRPLHRLQGICTGDHATTCANNDDCPNLGTCTVQNDAALAPDDFAQAYDVQSLRDAGLDGTGRSIAVLARSTFPASDVAHFTQQFVPARTQAPVRVLAGADPGILADPDEQVEVLLDTQWAGALAPGAQVNVVIAAPQSRGGDDIPGALDKAIRDRTGDIISLSFGLCETSARAL